MITTTLNRIREHGPCTERWSLSTWIAAHRRKKNAAERQRGFEFAAGRLLAAADSKGTKGELLAYAEAARHYGGYTSFDEGVEDAVTMHDDLVRLPDRSLLVLGLAREALQKERQRSRDVSMLTLDAIEAIDEVLRR